MDGVLESRVSQLWSKYEYHFIKMVVEEVDEQLPKVVIGGIV